MDDVERSIHTYIGCDKHFLEVVENVVVHLALAGHGTSKLTEETLLGFFETAVKRLFLLLLVAGEEVEESHSHFIFATAKVLLFCETAKFLIID